MTDKNRVALVTGAASGIGRASAEAFVRRGYRTALVDRDATAGDEVEAQLSRDGECRFFSCDVADAEAVDATFSDIIGHFGRLDAAFNGAGINGDMGPPAAEGTLENWDRVMSVNLRGMWLCLRREIQQMQQQGSGAIVNCASTQGLFGVAGLSAYVAAKHGVVGLTRAAALDYARSGIRINAVCPGMINTPMWQRSVPLEVEEQLLAGDPAGRLGEPMEIAEAVLWLCGESASFINGHAMVVDGGMTVQ